MPFSSRSERYRQTSFTSIAAEGTGIPVVFAAISDPEGAGLDMMENVTGTSDALNVASMVDVMYLLCPEIGKVGLLYSLSETNSEKPVKIIKSMLDDLTLKHEFEHLVAAALHRQVDVLANVGVSGHGGDDVVAQVLGIAGGEAHAHVGSCLGNHCQECCKVYVVRLVKI